MNERNNLWPHIILMTLSRIPSGTIVFHHAYASNLEIPSSSRHLKLQPGKFSLVAHQRWLGRWISASFIHLRDQCTWRVRNQAMLSWSISSDSNIKTGAGTQLYQASGCWAPTLQSLTYTTTNWARSPVSSDQIFRFPTSHF